MPKFTKTTVKARDAAAPNPSLLSRIEISAETNEKVYSSVQAKLDEIKRPKERERALLKRLERPLVPLQLTPEELEEIDEQHEQELWAQRKRAERYAEENRQKKDLGDRISDPGAGSSLLTRIGDTSPEEQLANSLALKEAGLQKASTYFQTPWSQIQFDDNGLLIW